MKDEKVIQMLERSLWQDFNRSRLFYNKNKAELICSSQNDTIIYYFRKDYLLRNKDTIQLSIQNITFFLDGMPVVENIIDAVEIHFIATSLNKEIFIFQRKDALHYMN